MEFPVAIDTKRFSLQGSLLPGRTDRAGVVCHPHPLYGGSMQNNVVQAGMDALEVTGWTGLRFNFRGVGGSAGAYDNGLGERRDVAAAVRFLKDRGAAEIVVIAYSFGAWVAAFGWPLLAELGVKPLILVAPPAAFMSFDGLPPDTGIGRMICGEFDEIAPPDLAARIGASLNQPVVPEIVRGADHFFGGRESRLTALIAESLASFD